MNNYQQIAERISRSKYGVALTGAGISVESGIPDFRSPGGLWSKYDPREFGYIESFRANPGKVWKMLVELDEVLMRADPNPAHLALAELEKRGILKVVITQNVDSLHQRAGSTKVVEFHGNNRTLRCDSCRQGFPRETVSMKRLPPLCPCGNALRPRSVTSCWLSGLPLQSHQHRTFPGLQRKMGRFSLKSIRRFQNCPTT